MHHRTDGSESYLSALEHGAFLLTHPTLLDPRLPRDRPQLRDLVNLVLLKANLTINPHEVMRTGPVLPLLGGGAYAEYRDGSRVVIPWLPRSQYDPRQPRLEVGGDDASTAHTLLRVTYQMQHEGWREPEPAAQLATGEH